jgi:hypothetical protein
LSIALPRLVDIVDGQCVVPTALVRHGPAPEYTIRAPPCARRLRAAGRCGNRPERAEYSLNSSIPAAKQPCVRPKWKQGVFGAMDHERWGADCPTLPSQARAGFHQLRLAVSAEATGPCST